MKVWEFYQVENLYFQYAGFTKQTSLPIFTYLNFEIVFKFTLS